MTDERAALMMPPFRHNLMRRLTVPGERVGLQLLPQLAGLLIIEARKEIYAGTPAVDHVRPSSRRYVPILEGVAANRAHPRDPRPHGGGPHDERSRPNARPPPKFAGLPPHGGAIDETLRPIDRAPAF